MSDSSSTTPPAPTGSDGPTGPEDGSHAPSWIDTIPDDAAAEIRKLRSENAGSRTRYKAAESERDQLRTRLSVFDQAQVEQLAGERLHDPADLTDRVGLDELRGEDGTLDLAKVAERIEQLVTSKPHLAKVQNAADFGGGRRGVPVNSAPSFGEALKARGK